MKWWWQKHDESHAEHDGLHRKEQVVDDADKRRVRREQEFIRLRLRNLERLTRGERWIPPY